MSRDDQNNQGMMDQEGLGVHTSLETHSAEPYKCREKGLTRARWNLLRRFAPILVMFGLVACSAIESPPRDLITKHDHAALATWYAKEAANLRWKAEEIRQMQDIYSQPSYQPAPKESKAELIAHCQRFIEYYTQAAEEAERIAQAHRASIGQKSEVDH